MDPVDFHDDSRAQVDEASVKSDDTFSEIISKTRHSLQRSSLTSSVRSQLSRRTSLAAFIQDCPICLDEMKSVDIDHILQCERHCGFNMCKNCIESLISSSKDDFQLASDGNLHVKVYLHCPNCRSDLSHTIRHTLLLRKVDEVSNLCTPQSMWTSSQIRLQKALPTSELQKAIRHARILESEYFGTEFQEDIDIDSQIDDYVEQWGVEADITNGVHDSFIIPNPPDSVVRDEAIRVDPTLFAGLDAFLTEDERKEITTLMTAGKPSSLVKAAQMLYDALHRLSIPEGGTATKPQSTKERTKSDIRKSSLCRRSSVFQLIKEAEDAEGKQNKDEVKLTQELQAMRVPRSRIEEHRQLERELRIQANFQKRFPIPVRMPKTVKLDLSLPFDMELIDFSWGGTVMDAYSKISIGFGNKVTQRRPNNINVWNILGTEVSYVKSAAVGCAIGLCMGRDEDFVEKNDIFIAMPGQARVLISHTGHIGKLGAVRGDVLTHIDGESVVGKRANEVLGIIEAKNDQDSIMLTLNAEFSIADALRRRAQAISEIEVL